jgi:hypothetical protein
VAQFEVTNVTVIQGIRSIGMGADINIYDGGTNVDMIDIHLDRLAPAPLFVWADRLAFPGQTSKTGRFRIWHSSFEGMSDDVMDDLSAESNVVKIDRATNSVLNWELQGRHAEAGGRAPAAIHNVSIVDNDMYYSPTLIEGGDTWYQMQNTLIQLGAVQNLLLARNSIHLAAGMPTNLPIVQLCNVRGHHARTRRSSSRARPRPSRRPRSGKT